MNGSKNCDNAKQYVVLSRSFSGFRLCLSSYCKFTIHACFEIKLWDRKEGLTVSSTISDD